MPKKGEHALDIECLRAFLAVMEYGTHQAAATALSCAQSTVTDRIAKLEGWLGLPLFDREFRARLPTSAATAFERTAMDVLKMLGDFRAKKGTGPDQSKQQPPSGGGTADGSKRAAERAALLSWWMRAFPASAPPDESIHDTHELDARHPSPSADD